MKTIPLNAVVKCTDGPAGRSSAVVIDPIQPRVTHIVVKDPGQKIGWSEPVFA